MMPEKVAELAVLWTREYKAYTDLATKDARPEPGSVQKK
jgi:hypothetical protein